MIVGMVLIWWLTGGVVWVILVNLAVFMGFVRFVKQIKKVLENKKIQKKLKNFSKLFLQIYL